MTHGTPSEIDGRYIQFQTEVLRQLPRPGLLDEQIIDGWLANRSALKSVLHAAILPERSGSQLRLLKKQVQLDPVEHYSESRAFDSLWRRDGYMSSRGVGPTTWSKIASCTVPSTTLRVYEVLSKCSIIDAFRTLGERSFTEWVDVFRLLSRQCPTEGGDLSRHYTGNFFFIDGRLYRVVLSDEKQWILAESPLLPGTFGYLDLRKGARIFVR